MSGEKEAVSAEEVAAGKDGSANEGNPAAGAAVAKPENPTLDATKPTAQEVAGFDDRTKVSFVGICVGLVLLGIGLALLFIPGRPDGLGNMPILIACVGLGAVLAGLGAQARYISDSVALGGGVAIAFIFYLTFVQINKEVPSNRYEGRLTVLSSKADPVEAKLWISNEQPVQAESVTANGDLKIVKFNLNRDQVTQLFDTYCSRIDVKSGTNAKSFDFDPSKLARQDFVVVMRLYYDILRGDLFDYTKRGQRRGIIKSCPPDVEVAEKNAVVDDVKQALSTKSPVVAATSQTVQNSVATSSGPARWSYFGIRSEAENGFVEKTFDIVARASGSPPVTANSVPLKGDTLLALVDVRVREGARRLVPGTTSQWVNPPLVGVVKAGERVKVVDAPRIANSVSHWVPISDVLD